MLKDKDMLRTLFRSDLPKVLAIEKAVSVVPWTEETFNTCFESGYVGWVVELEEKIIGFVVVSVTNLECHILNLSVSHDYQHQGYGQKLLSYALDYAKNKGLNIAYLEVRRSNSRAIALYRKLDFQLVGERKGYYPTLSGQEDALVFAKNLRLEPS